MTRGKPVLHPENVVFITVRCKKTVRHKILEILTFSLRDSNSVKTSTPLTPYRYRLDP